MKSSVCTLFEGNYHFGVAALVNSLCVNGFEGVVYAGYRGQLPPWAVNAINTRTERWNYAATLQVTEHVRIVFLRLDTDYHLTNYKPDFMLELLDGPASEDESLFYFDPDVLVNERWTYFEEWVSCGIALCEDVNSPVSENHPRRIGWRRFYSVAGYKLGYKTDRYVNGGAIGVTNLNSQFLSIWKQFNELMGQQIGGMSVTSIGGGQSFTEKGFANCFDIADQDALNATIEYTDINCSILGKEAMAFKPGAAILPHALGAGKPWDRSYVKFALNGQPPRFADKLYWQYTSYPIASQTRWITIISKMSILISSFVGRTYRRT